MCCSVQRLCFSQQKTRLGGFFVESAFELLQVLADQAGHFKHGDLSFTKDSFELVVGIDSAAVHAVLQVVFLDVDPHLADHFGTWQWG